MRWYSTNTYIIVYMCKIHCNISNSFIHWFLCFWFWTSKRMSSSLGQGGHKNVIDCTILKKLHDSWTNSNLFWLFFSFNFFVNFVFDIFQGPTYFSCTYIWRCFEGTGKTFWCHYLNNLQFCSGISEEQEGKTIFASLNHFPILPIYVTLILNILNIFYDLCLWKFISGGSSF